MGKRRFLRPLPPRLPRPMYATAREYDAVTELDPTQLRSPCRRAFVHLQSADFVAVLSIHFQSANELSFSPLIPDSEDLCNPDTVI
jgi:hypothetical protein